MFDDGECKSPLKLIIMSATLDVSSFAQQPRLFSPPPPIIEVAGRQYDVIIHFNRKTVLDDYTTAAFTKVRSKAGSSKENYVLLGLFSSSNRYARYTDHYHLGESWSL